MFNALLLTTIVLTFTLLNLGGLVHNTGSSLACPDWPLCYGQLMPKMEGNILIEHGHRMMASLVGLLTIFLVILSGRKSFPHKKIFKLTLLSLFLVIMQGLLGGLTVLLKLPTLVSTMHLGLSIIFFSCLVFIHHKYNEQNYLLPKEDSLISKWNPHTKFFIILAAIGTYAQMLLGAFMRHTGAGPSCGLGYQNAIMCFDLKKWVLTWAPSATESQLHMGHRYFALFVALLVLLGSLSLLNLIRNIKGSVSTKQSSRLQMLAIVPLLLVVVQIGLGVLTVGTGLGVTATTLHLAGAALLFVSLYKSFLTIRSIELNLSEKFSEYFLKDLVNLTKPRLSALVILTAAVGLILAPGNISFFKGLVAIFSTSFIVAGACVINCYIERSIDTLMERTKNRPLPAKRLHPLVALGFGILLLAFFVPVQFLLVNSTTGFLGLSASLIYIFLYTPLKRKTTLSLFIGAIPGAIPPMMGWTAVTNSIDPLALVLFLILFLWQLPHFLSIAIVHHKDFANANIQVLPNIKGKNATLVRILIYTLLLGAAGYMPVFYGVNHPTYKAGAIILTLAFLVCALYGFQFSNDLKQNKKWARLYFLASLIYLPSLLGILVFFK